MARETISSTERVGRHSEMRKNFTSQRLEGGSKSKVWKKYIRWVILAAGFMSFLFLGVLVLRSDDNVVPGASPVLDDPTFGSESARVTIVEYGDFGCTTCKAWFQAAIKEQVLLEYGGDVRFVWRDFPVITAQSPKAAEAGQCAHEQGKFWDYHNLLYYYAPKLNVDDLKSYAAQMGLDSGQFDECLDSGKYQAAVASDLQDALQRGFRGTPTFLINDQVLVGPPSYGVLKQRIDAILSSGG